MAHFLISLAFLLPLPLSAAETAVLRAGSLISVELVDPVDTGASKAGELFRGRVQEGVWDRGRIAIPPGTVVRGELTKVKGSGHVRGRAELELTLRELLIDGSTYTVRTDTLTYLGDKHAGRGVGALLGGALQGALYGVLFGGKEGAVIGAGAGAGAGAAGSVLKGKVEVRFEKGALFLFELREDLSLPVYAAPEPPKEPKPAPAPPQPTPAEPATKPSS